MKVVQVAGWFFPETTGGTEVYVDGLCRGLVEEGIEAVVACPTVEPREWDYTFRGTPVHRYPIGRKHDIRQIRGLDPDPGLQAFGDWLGSQDVDIYHQHSWSLGCGLHQLRLAATLGIPCFLTIHTPSPICMRGTMRLFGAEPCDGHIEIGRCSQCWFDSRGGPGWARSLIGALPTGISSSFSGTSALSTTGTALAMPALVQSVQRGLEEVFEITDKVVAVCDWLKAALLSNGAPADKVVLCRQGVVLPKESSAEPQAPLGDGLQVGFIGRWDPVKGVDFLVDAFQKLPDDLPIQLQIYGPADDEPSREFRAKVLAKARDPRIQIHRGLSTEQVFQVLRQLDALAVPSRWMETGPYVVLEAQAMQVPVLGSDLGGISELATPERGGVLLPPEDRAAWTGALERLATDPDQLRQLKSRIPQPRRMARVAVEMQDLYLEALKG